MKLGRLSGIVGGAVILGALFVALVAGMKTPGGRATLTRASDFLTGAGDWARTTLLPIPRTPAAGDAGLAAFVALLGYSATVLLVSGARTGRGAVFALLAWVVLGGLLYMPGAIPGLSS